MWLAHSLFKTHLLGLLPNNLAFTIHYACSCCSALASCSSQNKFQDCYYRFQARYCISNSHTISPPLSHGMCPCDHCDLDLACQYAFHYKKRQCQCLGLSYPSPKTYFGKSCHVTFHAFPLFLLRERDSSIIFFRVLSPVFPLHPLTSRFVISPHLRM